MTPFIMVLFFGISIFIRILLMKILIAIMGSSFNNNYKYRDSNAKLSQLAFIVENWYIQPIKDKEKIVYLIAAFKTDDEKQEEQ